MSGGDISTFSTSHTDSLLEIGPRPPTSPGQEEEHTKNKENIFCNSNSTLTPRKSNLHGFKNSEFDQCFPHCLSKSRCRCRHYQSVMEDGLDGDPPLGYEPEGSSSACDSSPYAESQTPPYIKWAQNLSYLLKDCDGVELFKKYLLTEGCSDSLNFWFACEGLKKDNDPARIQQLIRAIYRKYVRPQNTVHLTLSTKKYIKDNIISKSTIDRNIFDEAQHEEEQFISKSTYPNFLKSDIYLHYVQSMQNGAGEDVFSKNGDAVSSNNSSVPSSRSSNYGGKGEVTGPLPTVLEDCELNVTNTTLTLTSSHLLATEKFRVGYGDVIRRPEAYAGVYLNQVPKSKLTNPYHAMYGTQIPGSAQDSELQSLSSDAHTDETMSLDSSLDGRSGVVSRKYSKQQKLMMKQNANQNYDPHNQLSMIPRTNKFNPKTPVQNEPNEFAATLIKKLEDLKKSQEASEKVAESINKFNQEMEITAKENARAMPPLTTLFNAAIANIEPGDTQSILDDHVSRIWNDSAHHTPVITPGHQSPLPVPCPKSPERRRASAPPFSNKINYYHKHRKERDLASTISSDSGAIPDYVDGEISSVSGSDSFHYYNKHSHHPGKSKSGTAPVEPVPTELLVDMRERRAKESGKRSLGRKCFMDSTSSGIDSGVSMANEPNQQSSIKVLDWFMANNSSQPGESEKESFARHKRSNHSSLSATSPGPNRQSRSKKQQNPFVSSRSGSTERSGHTRSTSAAQPAQPIMGVHSMPMLPPPNTTTQLEEARRRLEDDTKKLSKSKSGVSLKERVPDLVKGVRVPMKSSINTDIVLDSSEDPLHSRKTTKKCSSSNASLVTTPINQVAPEMEYTVVGYQFGEDVPYLSKLAGKNITLKQFKTLITKKENFRYFFKKADNEFGTGIVYEEIGNDNEVLPLWEGKLFAKLEITD